LSRPQNGSRAALPAVSPGRRIALLPRRVRGRLSPEEVGFHMRHYEVMVIDPDLEERQITPTVENFLNVIRTNSGTVEKVDIWGRRRLAYEIKKSGKKVAEGIYAVINLNATPAVVNEFDRQLNLNEGVLRTKVIRPDQR
jgi:small subunit ribosomal protein S6